MGATDIHVLFFFLAMDSGGNGAVSKQECQFGRVSGILVTSLRFSGVQSRTVTVHSGAVCWSPTRFLRQPGDLPGGGCYTSVSGHERSPTDQLLCQKRLPGDH